MENILLFDKPATVFEEAIPMGNGHMGAMVYGGTDTEKISLNEDTLWSGSNVKNPVPEKAKESFEKGRLLALNGCYKEAEEVTEVGMNAKNTQVYMPLGNLVIKTDHKDYTNYSRILDMSTSVAKVTYEVDGVLFEREYVASFENRCIAVKISANQKCQVNFSMFLETEHKEKSRSFEDGKLTLLGYCPSDGHSKFGYKYDENDKNGLNFACMVRVDTNGKLSCESGYEIKVEGADYAVIYICAETDFNNQDELVACKTAMANCKEYASVLDSAVCDYKKLYDRVEFSLKAEENKKTLEKRLEDYDGSDLGLIELLFNFGRYLTIVSSRKGTQATNLQGIWNEKWLPIWSSNYTLNINTQMNYWPTLSANLSECYYPFLDLVEKLRVTGRDVAKDFYGARGFVCHHNTDIWGHANPVGEGNRGTSNYTCWNMASGWLACQIYDFYEYTEDENSLKEVILPTMEEAMLFYFDIMVMDENGYYIVTPTTSPENFFLKDGEFRAISKTSTMSISIIRELLTKIISAHKILGTQSEISKKAEDILPKLYPFGIASDGTLLEWDEEHEEKDSEHRHISHLYSLFPGEFISKENTPELFEACRKSLIKRGDLGTGWSIGWKENLWASLGDGDKAFELLKRQLKLVDPHAEFSFKFGGTYPNLFDAHPPFQIDGNFGALSAICNMMVQVKNERICILPALPKLWQDGYIKGLKIKGNIEVDIFWQNQEPSEVTLTAQREKTVDVVFCGKTQRVTLKEKIPHTIRF